MLVQFQLCRVLRYLMLQEISRKAYVGLLVKRELFLVQHLELPLRQAEHKGS